MKTTNKIPYFSLILMSVIFMFATSCKKDPDDVPPPTENCRNTDPIIIPGDITTGENWASIGGLVQATGGPITSRGVCWSTHEDPTVSDFSNNSGSGDGSFTCTMNGLNRGTTYFVRLFAITCNGTSYVPAGSFQTQVGESLPAVTTNEVTNIFSMSATCGGNVTDDGKSTVTARGVCINKTGNPTLSSNEGYTINGSGTGPFSSALMALEDDQTYYVRAYATNSKGTAYGNERVFKTDTRKILLKVTNLSVSQGDEPSISEFPDGRNFRHLYLNSVENFQVEYSDQHLYIWTCPANASCYWKPYSIPWNAGTYIDYLEGTRKIRIYRERG